MPDIAPNNERPQPLLACAVDDGRLTLAPARGGGTHLFWQDDAGADAMVGTVAVIMDTMRGLRCMLAGRTALRCCAGYPIREDRYRPGHWFVATLTGMQDDYELMDDGRELWWFDPTDRLAEVCAPRAEPEVQSVVLARATATLRGALTRTGTPAVKAPAGSATGPRTARPPARLRKASAGAEAKDG
jgi:hypothetical protein